MIHVDRGFDLYAAGLMYVERLHIASTIYACLYMHVCTCMYKHQDGVVE